MNNLKFTRQSLMLKIVSFVCLTLFITACADSHVVSIDTPVQQVNDLRDYDSDGVIKAREKCDNTIQGALIDNYGCGTQTIVSKPFKVDIKFPNNSFIVPAAAYPEVKKLADFLNAHQDISVVIEGHTSKVGNVELNQVLSENRAKAVMDILINDYQVSPSRLSSVGYGFSRLAQEGDSERAHAANRRIMAELSNNTSVDILKWTIYTVDKAD
ncbi:OmpA family protein [Thalassotalea piscium]